MISTSTQSFNNSSTAGLKLVVNDQSSTYTNSFNNDSTTGSKLVENSQISTNSVQLMLIHSS